MSSTSASPATAGGVGLSVTSLRAGKDRDQ